MAKFENVKTKVRGFIIDPMSQAFDPFEVEINYTRSAERASKLVAELLEVEAPKLVSITELVNPRAERKQYNWSKVVELATNTSDEAIEGWIKAVVYEVSGYAWVKTSEGQFGTQYVEYETPTNLTRVNLRQSIANVAREQGVDVLAVADEQKTPKTIWCEITPENLAKCEKQKPKK